MVRVCRSMGVDIVDIESGERTIWKKKKINQLIAVRREWFTDCLLIVYEMKHALNDIFMFVDSYILFCFFNFFFQ